MPISERSEPNPGWRDSSLVVTSDSKRTAMYRRLQSWYREVQLGVLEPGMGANARRVGSMVPSAVVDRQPDLNLLAPAAYEHAECRIREVRAEGGTLEEDRLRRNLLSSMPLCFNIFGALGTHPAFIDLIRRLVDYDADRIDQVVCEWTPKPVDEFLGDRSAFDAFVSYDGVHGSSCFVGVETKYIEPFSQVECSSPVYERVTRESGWFVPGAFDVLKATKTNQLWRTVMLAAALENSGRYQRGHVLLLTLEDDRAATRCVEAVRDQLTEPDRLLHVTYEDLVETASRLRDPDVTAWAARFALRYLDARSVDDARAADDDGPRLGPHLSAAPRRYEADASVSPRLIELLSWEVASRLVRRHPKLHIAEEHPGWGDVRLPHDRVVRDRRRQGRDPPQPCR
jgi:hypothetical protein